MIEEVATPVGEVIQPEKTVETKQESKESPHASEAPVGEALGDKKPVDSVPIARLNKEITRRKELEKELADLRTRASDEKLTHTEITTDLKALAEEHNIDPSFLDKLAKTIKAQAEANVDEKLRPIAEREALEKKEKAFDLLYSKTLQEMPEFQGIVNPAVIKQMAFNPANAGFTMRQLIEEAYGSSLQGKRTTETTTARGGVKTEGLDMNRAQRDPEYFKEVMADPQLKAEYNKDLLLRIKI